MSGASPTSNQTFSYAVLVASLSLILAHTLAFHPGRAMRVSTSKNFLYEPLGQILRAKTPPITPSFRKA